MPTDDELVDQACRGESGAFEELIRRYERMVQVMAYGMVGSADAQDVAQETFLEAYTSLSRFRRESSFKTWVTRILMHRAANFIRRRATRATYPLDTYLEIPDPSSGPVLAAEKNERDEMVQTAIARLPVEYREALVLRVSQGLSYEEIAAVLECAVGTVKSRLHNARERVADYLKEHS